MMRIENLQKTNAEEEFTLIDQCKECTNFRDKMARYQKLIELLYKKIRKLESKSIFVDENNRWRIQANKTEQKNNRFSISSELEVKIEGINRIQKQKEHQFQKPFNKLDNIQQKIKQIKKTGLIEKMSETIMQLKTNLMHIRSCVYFVFKEANLWKITEKNQLAKNTMEVLFNIFQYSENQRDEICRIKRVKLRRIEKKSDSKQNIYITVKEI